MESEPIQPTSKIGFVGDLLAAIAFIAACLIMIAFQITVVFPAIEILFGV